MIARLTANGAMVGDFFTRPESQQSLPNREN